MKPADLQDGAVYQLTRDVINPEPDRRRARQWTAAPVWKKGLRVVCMIEVSNVGKPFRHINLRAAGRYDDLGLRHDGFAALVAALEPAPRNFDNVMFGLNRSPSTDVSYAILEELVRQGQITLDAIEAAHTTYSTRPETEDA